MQLKRKNMKLTKLTKRAIDVAASILLLLILAPILAISALAILVLEGRPIFYISRRHITIDRAISIIKFRTMVLDAKSEKYDLHGRFMRDGYLDIPVDCEVYTRIGRILEKSQLVETLQLFNVLLHDMSLIGNRPLPSVNVDELKKFEGWQERFASPAGITGVSQVVGKLNQQPIERLELEGLYSKVYNEGNVIKCDFFVAYYTVRLVLLGKPLSIEKARELLNRCL